MQYKFENLNQALIGLSKEILKYGKPRKTRGFDCIEFTEPVMIEISNPIDNVITIPERKWAKTLPFAESLWLASGTNHMGLVGKYAPNMYSFSDDGEFMRAAYGPRLRAFHGFATDYAVSNPLHRNIFSGHVKTVDQLKFVIDSLKRDVYSRQALMTIHDPVCDDYDEKDVLKVTKDTPCCRSIHFMVVDGKLDCILTIRSNDLLWGLSAVNVFNFTWMQQYVAMILGLPIGRYFHIAHNIHFYDDKREMIETFANLNIEDYPSNSRVQYGQNITFEEFDKKVNQLFFYEEKLRIGECSELIEFGNDMFDDWAKVFYRYWTKNEVNFVNSNIQKLFYGTSNS